MLASEEDELRRAVAQLQRGDPGPLEAMIQFLEADPWSFRSGYAKQRVMATLGRHDLSASQTERLSAVLLHVVDVGGRTELREACRLARRLRSSSLRRGLHERLAGASDTGIARRSLLMLLAMRKPRLSPAEQLVVRDLIARAAADQMRWYSAGRWVRRALPLVATPSWISGVGRQAADGDPGALRLLGQLSGEGLSEEHRERIGARLLEAVRAGGGESWIEGVATLVATEALEEDLQALRRLPYEEVSSRAWWALRAIQLQRERGS